MQFTVDQQKVIDARKKNILVSAAAGSGKTAVLVERIIQKVIDEKNPVDIDKLLIVTFTSAAASEMRERIFTAINQELLLKPESEHLQRQAALIHNAQITTIHSFCLQVIRNYFSEIQLDPSFRIADEGELKLIKKEVMEELLEDCYEEKTEEFLHFVETYGSGNQDKVLEDLIEKVYQFTMSFPMPDLWIKECVENLNSTNKETVLGGKTTIYLLDYTKKVLLSCESALESAMHLALTKDGPYMYEDNLKKDLESIRELLSCCENYEIFREKMGALQFSTLSRKSDSSVSEYKKESVKALRNDVKDCLKKLQEKFFFDTIDSFVTLEQHAAKALETLLNLVGEFSDRLTKAKQEKNILDFNDMEHYALKILLKEEDGVFIPTKVAKDYQNYFEEIIVDEYQDSNFVQEYILSAVSKESSGLHNRFMVGDVKQSIYRFRLARPELFMEKYVEYPKKPLECEKIDLSMNFRSRQEVLDCVNLIFSQLMDASFGGISYDKDAYLYYGASYYPENKHCESELLLIEKPDKEEGDNAKEREAKVIARKIKEFVGKMQVYDKNTGTMRYATYKDIVILLRSNKGWDNTFKAVLTEEMIPCHTESKSGYFDTMEIRSVVEFLKILDNPMQDIALYGVMTSIFGGFCDEEMAQIKAYGEEKPVLNGLYDRVKLYALEKKDALAEKITSFLEMIMDYRVKARYLSIRQLLQQLFTQFDYVAVVSSMKGGVQRRANVELLLQKASAYEKTSYVGAFHFVRYLQHIMEKEVEYGEADILDENADVVRIMSIHKSKGLEFPICFVAGLGKKMNLMDTHQVLVADSDMGLGTDCIDYETRIQSRTLSKSIIVQKMINDSLAEEIRILYVALTRAREKLILSGVVSNLPKKMTSLIKYTYFTKQTLPFYELVSAGSHLDYVLMALSRSESMREIYQMYDVPVDTLGNLSDAYANIKIQCISGEENALDEGAAELQEEYNRVRFENEVKEFSTRKGVEALKEKLSFSYGHKNLEKLYTKTTVSELKKAAFENYEEAKPMFEEEKEKVTIPKFMKEAETVLGTTRGTAFHKVMEVFPFEKLYGVEDITEEMVRQLLKEQAEGGKLPKEYIPLVSVKKILHFLKSNLASRMIKAAKKEKLYKEQPFVYGIKASRLNKEFPDTETVLIQGIIDAYFEEDDKIVLLDYKTDVIKSEEELIKRYQVQLDYYAEVLNKLLSKPVDDVIIYSFYLEKELKL